MHCGFARKSRQGGGIQHWLRQQLVGNFSFKLAAPYIRCLPDSEKARAASQAHILHASVRAPRHLLERQLAPSVGQPSTAQLLCSTAQLVCSTAIPQHGWCAARLLFTARSSASPDQAGPWGANGNPAQRTGCRPGRTWNHSPACCRGCGEGGERVGAFGSAFQAGSSRALPRHEFWPPRLALWLGNLAAIHDFRLIKAS